MERGCKSAERYITNSGFHTNNNKTTKGIKAKEKAFF